MSDCEDVDFFWKSWISPVKSKRKKESKKNNKGQKCKNNTTMKTNESVQKKKKKKNSKFKEAMERRKDKKKKKKNKLALDLDDSLTCGISATVPTAQAKPEALNLRSSTEKLNPDQLTQDSKKKTKRKKKVMFDLSPGYIQVKRPKFVSPSLQSPGESILSENEAVGDGERCSQVTEQTGQSQGQLHDNDSQCSGDNMNSQDLFITQKTFRGSPSYASSGEASDKAVIASPQMFTQRDTELPEVSHKTNGKAEKEKRTWRELNTNLTEEKDVSCPTHARPNVVNPYLDEPIVVNTSLDVAKSKTHSCASSQQVFSCPFYTHDELSLLPLTPTASTSTQTENFFTTELSSYLNFCKKSKSAGSSEDSKPLDLSLPQRVRKDLCSCSSVTEFKDDEEKYGKRKPLCLLKGHGARLFCSSEVKKEPRGPQLRSVRAKSKGEPTPSPQSESEPKSTDTTTSSEDNEPHCRSSKVDLTQVRAVQMRLNESFFFKTKGEGQSPRPESPLMKLVQGRDMKSRKGH